MASQVLSQQYSQYVGVSCVAATQLPNEKPNPVQYSVDPESVGSGHGSGLDDNTLDQLIVLKTGEIHFNHSAAKHHHDAERVCWRGLIPLLDEMRARLTQRGRKSQRNYSAYLRSKGLNPSTVRSWRRRLKLEKSAASEAVERKEEAPDNLGNYEFLDEREEVQSGQELIAKFICQMRQVLTAKTIMSDSARIARATDMLRDLERANNEGMLFPAERSSYR